VSTIGALEVSYIPIPKEARSVLISFSTSTALCAISEKGFAKMRSSCNLKYLSIKCATKARIAFPIGYIQTYYEQHTSSVATTVTSTASSTATSTAIEAAPTPAEHQNQLEQR